MAEKTASEATLATRQMCHGPSGQPRGLVYLQAAEGGLHCVSEMHIMRIGG